MRSALLVRARFTIYIHWYTRSLTPSLSHSIHVLFACSLAVFVRSVVALYSIEIVVFTMLSWRLLHFASLYILLLLHTFTCACECVRLRVSVLFCLVAGVVVTVVVVILVGFCFRYLNSLISSHSSHSLLCVRCSTPKIESNRATHISTIHTHNTYETCMMYHTQSYSSIARGGGDQHWLGWFAVR